MKIEVEQKHHTESTLRAEENGIVARCECGWVSGWHISSLAASAALMDHRERERAKGDWPMKTKKALPKDLPKEVLVYEFDEADGQPVYVVALNVDEIDENADGKKVGVYILQRTDTFRIRRELE